MLRQTTVVESSKEITDIAYEQASVNVNNANLEVEKLSASYGELLKEYNDKKTSLDLLNSEVESVKINLENLKNNESTESQLLSEINESYKQLQLLVSEETEKLRLLNSDFNNLSDSYKKKEEDIKVKYQELTTYLIKEVNSLTVNIDSQKTIIKNNEYRLSSIYSTISDRENKVAEFNKELANKNDELVKINAILDSKLDNEAALNTSISNLEKIESDAKQRVVDVNNLLNDINLKSTVAQATVDEITKKGANILRRDDYLKGQEAYLKDQYNRLGLTYQEYAE